MKHACALHAPCHARTDDSATHRPARLVGITLRWMDMGAGYGQKRQTTCMHAMRMLHCTYAIDTPGMHVSYPYLPQASNACCMCVARMHVACILHVWCTYVAWMYGASMLHMWNMYVACMSNACCTHGPCMLHVCCLYAACMLPVCCLYAACMLHVCCMYVTCMSHVCRMHGARTSRKPRRRSK